MDKELAKLEEWGVNLINDYEEVLQKTDPKSSQHKRIKRFSGELVANPEAYGELLDMARSKNLSAKELLQSIRSIESNLLDEASRGTSMSRKQLMSDVIHHMFAQRTGGDTLRRLAQGERSEARKILRDSFGRWGNVPENLQSLFRSWHLKSDVLKGVEAEALQPFGITKAGDLSTKKAHTTSPVSKEITGTIPATTAAEAVEGMTPQFEIQQKEGLAAIQESQPLMRDLDEISGIEYSTTLPSEQLKIRRDIFTAKPEQVKAAIQRNVLNFSKSSARITKNIPGLFGIIPEYGEAIDEITGGRVFGVTSEMKAAEFERKRQASIKAKERGGKLSIKFGSIKFTLPELGVSELITTQ